MPITEERMTRLLAAAQDFEAGLRRACEEVAQAQARVADGAGRGAEVELQILASMLTPEVLLASPVASLLAVEREAEHWTASRRARNAKRRRQDDEQGE